jgi:5-methylcytosine-specific restriction endonuclease McrA
MSQVSQAYQAGQAKEFNKVPVRVKHCKACNGTGHTAFNCPSRPRATLKASKPMKKIGRVGKETAKAVAKWKRTLQPNHQGYFVCYMCGAWVQYMTAEHTKSKARHPELRTDVKKLKLACDPCNEKKGSKDYVPAQVERSTNGEI